MTSVDQRAKKIDAMVEFHQCGYISEQAYKDLGSNLKKMDMDGNKL